jgi:hypothetical protein
MPHVEAASLDHNCNSSLPLTRDVLLDHTKLLSEVHGHVTATLVINPGTSSYCYPSDKA